MLRPRLGLDTPLPHDLLYPASTPSLRARGQTLALCSPRAAATEPRGRTPFLQAVQDLQATHNCWAYKVGAQYRFSDDGEPAGTAGRPILSAIEAQHLDRVMVVVTRYFGGIKLGVGGLVRAYGGWPRNVCGRPLSEPSCPGCVVNSRPRTSLAVLCIACWKASSVKAKPTTPPGCAGCSAWRKRGCPSFKSGCAT